MDRTSINNHTTTTPPKKRSRPDALEAVTIKTQFKRFMSDAKTEEEKLMLRCLLMIFKDVVDDVYDKIDITWKESKPERGCGGVYTGFKINNICNQPSSAGETAVTTKWKDRYFGMSLTNAHDRTKESRRPDLVEAWQLQNEIEADNFNKDEYTLRAIALRPPGLNFDISNDAILRKLAKLHLSEMAQM